MILSHNHIQSLVLLAIINLGSICSLLPLAAHTMLCTCMLGLLLLLIHRLIVSSDDSPALYSIIESDQKPSNNLADKHGHSTEDYGRKMVSIQSHPISPDFGDPGACAKLIVFLPPPPPPPQKINNGPGTASKNRGRKTALLTS